MSFPSLCDFVRTAAFSIVDWGKVLSCTNLVTIVSLTLGTAGVVLGVLGWLASLRGLKESAEAKAREKTAQDAARAARQELLLQRATEDFRSIAENVRKLTVAVAAADWGKTRELLPPIKSQLSEANGSFQTILKGIDMDKLDVAIRAVKALVKGLPGDGASIPPEATQPMNAQCDRIAELIDEIYGRLKYLKVEEFQ